MLRSIAEAGGIFIVSVLLLFVLSVLATANTHRASGMGYYNAKSAVFMILGGLYLALGLVMARIR
jgi:hypothetical protein